METRRKFLQTGLAAGTGLAFTPSFVCAAQQSRPSTVYTFDASPLRNLDLKQPGNSRRVWDFLHLAAALQGLANRTEARFYLLYCREYEIDTDSFWLDWLRGEDGWLKGTHIQSLHGLGEALQIFRDAYRGLVVYDPHVPATSNLASTASGVEALLPVRYDPSSGSLYDTLAVRMKIPVRLWLVHPDGSPKFTGRGTLPDSDQPSSGSAKVDAYRWAKARWLDTGRCAADAAAYYVDAYWIDHAAGEPSELHTLTNHDWFVAQRAFFFDLSPWGDEPPVDDPQQPLGADRECMLSILRVLAERANGRMIKLGGYPPWPYKYTTHARAGKHGGVPTEWEFVRLCSQFNAYTEADAAGLSSIANASFYRHYPLRAHYAQPHAQPTADDWRARGWIGTDGRVAEKIFVGFYVGDYDSPAWLYKAVPKFFRDPARGKVPLAWAFDPNLADRAPQALAYAYRHAAAGDFFIAGDSGAGYINPRALTVRPDSGLPSGLDAWREHCQKYYERWGMSITGFVLDGSGGHSTEKEFAAYRAFSPDGIGTHFETRNALSGGTPRAPVRGGGQEIEEAARKILHFAEKVTVMPGFFWQRNVLRPPEWYADLVHMLRKQNSEIEVVDPYTFFGLLRLHMEQAAQAKS